eukprot:PhM_4_TR6051/c0_g1_i1/m.86579
MSTTSFSSSSCRRSEATKAPDAMFWNRTPNWCDVCQEPFGDWNLHRVKENHRTLEQMFDAFSRYEERLWQPAVLYNHLGIGHNNMNISQIYGNFSEIREDRLHRLHSSVKYCYDNGYLPSFSNCKSFRQGTGAYTVGHRTLKWLVSYPLYTIFPADDSGRLSAIHLMSMNTMNCETLFDLLALRTIFPASYFSNATAVNTHSNKQQKQQKQLAVVLQNTDINVALKRGVVKTMFGDLWRFSSTRSHEASRVRGTTNLIPVRRGYHQVMVDYAMWGCVAELLLQLMSGYVTRIEKAWVKLRTPVTVPNESLAAPSHLGPPSGHRQYEDLFFPLRNGDDDGDGDQSK